jgi:hypothetical protein
MRLRRPRPRPAATTTRTRRAGGTTQTPASAATTTGNDPATRAVRATFETLLNGIRKSDVEMVMSVYWNSPQLVIFNNNGTVTRTWEQVRSNRASSYPDAKNVQLDVRDVRVQMTGRDGAVVSACGRSRRNFAARLKARRDGSQSSSASSTTVGRSSTRTPRPPRPILRACFLRNGCV